MLAAINSAGCSGIIIVIGVAARINPKIDQPSLSKDGGRVRFSNAGAHELRPARTATVGCVDFQSASRSIATDMGARIRICVSTQDAAVFRRLSCRGG